MAKAYFKRMIFIILLAVFSPIGVSATPLGSVSLTNYCSDIQNSTSVIFYTSLSDSDIENGIDRPLGVGGYFPSVTLDPFFRASLTSNDIGSSFTINQNNYEFWDSMINYVLTDGDQDISWYDLSWRDGPSALAWNFSQEYTGNGVDFRGYIIDNLFLTIDDLQVQETYPGNPGYYTWKASWTLTVDGQSVPVPESTTLLLFGAGLVGFAGIKIREK